ncbi:glycosyltransferase [Microlunatus flavus]|uniref:UDP-N-acetylglucosamine transferase subunit ALG13 n=1 Tax=Microlunatus flavus TaxID=1036181 RepID=A0A1H9H754_9ACTN|nr:glycosyltransferase [Microlunatus flavus]SEQ58164.1 UDP-N-acetylglucosamine transferase subunit ALG13 [Microlunatus flavus]
MSALSVPLRHAEGTYVPQAPGESGSQVAPACMLDEIPRGAKVLWVTSTGGHLAELNLIAERVQPSAGSRWVTFETAQSVDALRDRPHLFVDYVSPRDVRAAVRAARKVLPLLRRERFDACVSTGAGVAATILPLAAWSGIPTYYVESLARPHGPSTTGRILAHVPRVRTATQYTSWTGHRWSYAGSILQDWTVEQGPVEDGPLKILVTLGTIAPYRFDRAVDAVLSMLRPGDEVVWQLGSTTRTDLPGEVHEQVSVEHLNALSSAADVVVAHSGVGSVLQQFSLGKSPVLAVRQAGHDEHVDDHQAGLAEALSERGLAGVLDLAHPSRQTLVQAAARRVVPPQTF